MEQFRTTQLIEINELRLLWNGSFCMANWIWVCLNTFSIFAVYLLFTGVEWEIVPKAPIKLKYAESKNCSHLNVAIVDLYVAIFINNNSSSNRIWISERVECTVILLNEQVFHFHRTSCNLKRMKKKSPAKTCQNVENKRTNSVKQGKGKKKSASSETSKHKIDCEKVGELNEMKRQTEKRLKLHVAFCAPRKSETGIR